LVIMHKFDFISGKCNDVQNLYGKRSQKTIIMTTIIIIIIII
jgi:predicted nucleic acid-binding Zn ribbon protein